MNTVILACSFLEQYIDAAQEKMKTNFPVIALDNSLHVYPKKMREKIIETINALSDEVDTILVAMGYCGKSWEAIPHKQRIIIPRMDDCVTLLLHTDDIRHANLKKPGHFYLCNNESSRFSILSLREELCEKYGEKKGMRVFRLWFDSYTDIDVIENGICDCHADDFVEMARKSAELVESKLNYVLGSNLILEKLVSERWDEQFLIVEPERLLEDRDFA